MELKFHQDGTTVPIYMKLQFRAAETTETIRRVRHDVISGTVSLTDLITVIIDHECKKQERVVVASFLKAKNNVLPPLF